MRFLQTWSKFPPKELRTDYRLLHWSPLFDSQWYLDTYPDVKAKGMDPIEHYLRHGAREGRFPSRLFDSGWYLNQYQDVAASGQNPLVHYLRFGVREERDPNPLFHHHRGHSA